MARSNSDNPSPMRGDVGIACTFPETLGYRFGGRFEIPGRLLSKANSKAKYLEPKYKAFEERVAWIARSRLSVNRYHEGWVTIFPGSPDNRHLDPTNTSKSIIDALVKAEIFSDDKYVAGAQFPFAIGKPTFVEVWVK